MSPPSYDLEWLEADGLGAFASGTAAGVRTRRYHALLMAARTPPTDRVVLVDGCDATIDVRGERFALSSQRYAPDVTSPDGESRLVAFTVEPWPTWTHELPDGTRVTQERFVPHGSAAVALRWTTSAPLPGAALRVRPFLSGRDLHALHFENEAIAHGAVAEGQLVRWPTYPGMPVVRSRANAHWVSAPAWYRRFLLDEEAARGFEALTDCFSPGELTFDLSGGEAVWLLEAEGVPLAEPLPDGEASGVRKKLAATERARRRAFATPLARAADAYIVRRGTGRTIIAGYPWFTDWGRDTFIALRGLCLATGRLDDARAILLEWAGAVSEGMLPNRFLDQGDAPEFNAVDASLWYVVAVHEYLAASRSAGRRVSVAERSRLRQAVAQIVRGYAGGTRFGIGADADGLLRAGVPGVQLTWMDAKVGDWVVTPRIGKPVEVQALWINALRIAGREWDALRREAEASFASRYWNAEAGCLFDVADADGVAGRMDSSLRPNQIFAVGGLPYRLLRGRQALAVVATVERELLTPVGLRSLAPSDPAYVGRYEGGPVQRDGAYHQGTVWPWLIGAFVDAWLAVRGRSAAARAEAGRRFLMPLEQHLAQAGIGHVSEITDGDAPFTPRGCPFQAWSVGELLRVRQMLEAPEA